LRRADVPCECPLIGVNRKVLSGGGRRLRVIIEKLLERAEGGDLQAIRKIFDRLDGRPVQAIERGDARLEDMTDQQLMAIIRGGSPAPLDEPSYPGICPPSEPLRSAK
jgi:hypothetical protein